jgi:hypothetical protein
MGTRDRVEACSGDARQLDAAARPQDQDDVSRSQLPAVDQREKRGLVDESQGGADVERNIRGQRKAFVCGDEDFLSVGSVAREGKHALSRRERLHARPASGRPKARTEGNSGRS